MKFIGNFTVFCFIALLGLTVSACKQNCDMESDTNLQNDAAQYRETSKNLFTDWGYYVNSSNELCEYKYNNGKIETEIVLSDIVRVYYNEGTLAIDQAGAVWAWGKNLFGGLGLNHTKYQETPRKIEGLSNVKTIIGMCQSFPSYLKA